MSLNLKLSSHIIGNENSTCPICNSTHQQSTYFCNYGQHNSFAVSVDKINSGGLEKISLVHCDNCDFGYFSPRPSENFLIEHYKKINFGKKKFKDAIQEINGYDQQYTIYNLILLLERNGIDLKAFKDTDPVLEIGAGFSNFVAFGKKYNLNIYVNEPSNYAAKFNKKIMGVPVIKEMVNLIPKSFDEKFSFIYSSNSLEHHLDPSLSIKRMSELLRQNGYLAISVPNLNSIGFQTQGILSKYYHYPEHLNYFSIQSLYKLFKMNNLSPIDFTTYTGLAELTYAYGEAWRAGDINLEGKSIDTLARQNMLDNILVVGKKTH